MGHNPPFQVCLHLFNLDKHSSVSLVSCCSADTLLTALFLKCSLLQVVCEIKVFPDFTDDIGVA